MHSLQYKIHDIRYKVDYLKIRYKQHYYSNDRNPRVIQTKFKNQPLLSLRTQPHDKYFIKPGEFLALVPKKLDKIVNEINDVDTARYLKAQFLNQKALFQGYDDIAFTEKSDSAFDLEHDKCGKIRSYRDSCLNSSCSEIPNTGDHDQEIPYRPFSPYSILKPRNLDSIEDIEFNKENVSGISSNSWPLIDLNSTTSDERKSNPSNSYPSKSMFFSSSDLCDVENVKASSIGTSRVQSIASNIRTFGSNQELPHNNKKHRIKIQNSWKTVLNVISLSARKVSVGHSPQTCHDFENLTSDFINAKSAENRNDLKFDRYNENNAHEITGYIKDDYKSHTDHIESNKFRDGNVLKYPTMTDSIAQSHYYNDGGILSMYNYNSDNDLSF